MPTIALRVIAGFLQGERYSLRRGRVKPPPALLKVVFQFIEEEMENIEAAVIDDGIERPTAVLTLRLWIKLRTIILQDAAEIYVRQPDRLDHHMFRMPLFNSEEFKVSFVGFVVVFNLISNYYCHCHYCQAYVEVMRVALSQTDEPEDRSLERVLPHFQRQFNNMHECMQEIKTRGEETYEKVRSTEKTSKETQDQVLTMKEGLAAGFVGIASNLGGTHLRMAASPTATRREEPQAQEDEDDDWCRARGHKIQVTEPDSIRIIYNEFKGLHDFRDMPILGGLEGCDKKYKTKWRKHFNGADQKRFSRMSMLAKAIEGQVEQGRDEVDVLLDWDQVYTKDGNRSFNGLIMYLQDQGYIAKKGSRKKKGERSPGVGGGGGQITNS
jgi:hypothetical protein